MDETDTDETSRDGAADDIDDAEVMELLGKTGTGVPELDLPAALRRLVGTARDLTGARYGALAVLRPDGRVADFVPVGLDAAATGAIGRRPTGRGLRELVADGPVVLAGPAAAPRLPAGHPPVDTVLAVPVPAASADHRRPAQDSLSPEGDPPGGDAPAGDAGGRVAGVLYVVDKDGGFSERDVEVVVAVAEAAGALVDGAGRLRRGRRRERWLLASHEVTGALLTGADPGAALRLVAERARDAAGAPLGAIARPGADDPGTLVFEVVTSAVGNQDRLTGYTVPVDGSTASGLAFTSGEPVVVRGYGGKVATQQAGTEAGALRPPPAAVTGLDSAVAVPLTVGEETLGVLLVARFTGAPPFNEGEVRLVRRFAVDAALAIEFSRAEDDRRRLAVLEDRDRIARDLHDLVIQRLFAIGLGLEGVRHAKIPPDAAERMAGFVQELDRTIRDVRSAIFSLQEPADARGSLRSELLRLALDAVPVLGFEPRTSFSGPLDSVVPAPVRADLLATLREALSNVARHARAAAVEVEVSVDRTGRRLALSVSDDGVGVPPGPGRRSGLSNLARRAERWNGGLAVRRRQSGGTTLEWTAQLPVAARGVDG